MGNDIHGNTRVPDLSQDICDLFHVLIIKAAGRFIKKKIERLEAIAEAIATRCFWPPERDMGCLSLKASKSNRFKDFLCPLLVFFLHTNQHFIKNRLGKS